MELSSLLTLADWNSAYRAGASPRDLLEALRQRLDAESPIAAWISRCTWAQLASQLDALEARASACTDRASTMRAMPLFGVPFAVKDNIDVAGLATTAACPAFASAPEADAEVVRRLRAAGAICMGKTNLDQFATGLTGSRSPYGRPSSTLAADRISGGSSSGSAVVVSRGDVPFALGTDTAGSGRVPAAFNNVVGLKPTPGRVSTRGVLPACRSLDCVSVFALTVEDAATVLALAEGADPLDRFSAWRPGAARLPKALRVGIPLHAEFHGDAGYAAVFESAVACLPGLGHRSLAIDFAPLHDVAALLYEGPWVAERLAVVEGLLVRESGAIDPAVRQVIEAARAMSAVDVFRGQYALAAARRECEALWQQVDVLMVPTAPGHPRHREIDADPLRGNAALGLYTNFVNLLGWSALALPAGFTASGLPFGVTFVAPGGSDAALARFGLSWQTALGLRLGATRRSNALGDAAAESERMTADRPWPASRPVLPIAVVGAHLSGLALNGQLTERGAVLRETIRTAPRYRLYALPDTTPAKPGLLRVAGEGAAVELEVWELPLDTVGSFLSLVAAPLGIGQVELEDGRWVHGVVCEAQALQSACDVTRHGGWRAYLRALGSDSA
ncbi:MAG: allophanate hydrolase [Caldimonas sp.]